MTTLTPRYDPIMGSALSGTDGGLNRTYVLQFSNYYSVIEFLRQGAPLHEGVDFTISSNSLVTFLVNVFDTDNISLRYFTTDGSAIVSVGYGYVTTSDVYRTAGITSTEVSTNDVSNHILRAETAICRITKNIYWNIILNNQTATAGGNTTITLTGAGWVANAFADLYVWIYSGTGIKQFKKIISNTTDTLTVEDNWAVNPIAGSKFKVFYVPQDFNPKVTDMYDGNGLVYFYLPYYPVKAVDSLAIGYTSPVTVTPSSVYLYEKTGQIRLSTTSEASVFSRTYPQEINITYWYGVDYLPYDIKRLTELYAAMASMAQQMGGTFDDPSNIVLPEMTVSIGQAYINIKSSLETLRLEYEALLKQVKKWPIFG